MEDEKTYYNQNLISIFDSRISNNEVKVQAHCSENEYGLVNPIIQFSVNDYKNRSLNSIYMPFHVLMEFITQCKKVITSAKQFQDEIAKDSNFKKAFLVSNKKELKVTVCNKIEFSGMCFRVAVSLKEGSNNEAECSFITLYELVSIFKVMSDFCDNYSVYVNLFSQRSSNDKMLNELTDVKSLLRRLTQKSQERPTPVITESKNFVLNDLICSVCGSPQKISPTGPICDNNHNGAMGITKEEWEDENENDDMDDYLNTNLDTIELDSDIQETIDHVPRVPEIIQPSQTSFFTDVILDKSTENLENMINSSISSTTLLHSIVKVMNTKAGKDEMDIEHFFPGCSNQDYWLMNYSSTRLVKHFINLHLNNNKTLPKSTSPLRYKRAEGTEVPELNLCIMYELLMYFTVYSTVRNQLQEEDANSTNNKGVICFALKSILAPMIFSIFDLIPNQEILISRVSERFFKCKDEGVFDHLFDHIKSIYGKEVTISSETISTTMSTLSTAIKKHPDMFWIPNYFEQRVKDGSVLIRHDIFDDVELTEDKVNKILLLESNFKRGGFIDVDNLKEKHKINNFNDIPEKILKLVGVESSTFNTANLTRYVNEEMEEDTYLSEALKICEHINESYQDLKDGKFDFSNLPRNVLVSFCIWDMKADKKLSLNYAYLKKKIEESSLDKDSAQAILSNIVRKSKEYIDLVGSLNLE